MKFENFIKLYVLLASSSHVSIVSLICCTVLNISSNDCQQLNCRYSHSFLYSDIFSRLEPKIGSLINSTVHKFEENMNTFRQLMLSVNPLINDKMEQMNGTLSTNIFNRLEPKINTVLNDTVLKFNEKMNSLNELMLKMDLLKSDKLEQMEEKISTNIYKQLVTRIDNISNIELKLGEEIKLIDRNLKEFKCHNSISTSCHYLKGCDSGTYSIIVPQVSSNSFLASCDLETLGGGWTVIQRRQDGSENFYRKWSDYVEGFGDVNGEFFIGLRKLHALTAMGKPQELYIMFEDFKGEKRFARYGEFKIGSESTDYMLVVGQYSGSAGDNLSGHSGNKFSTRDRDNDDLPNYNCAEGYKSAWWYNNCFTCNLNGEYLREIVNKQVGVSWGKVDGIEYLLKFVQMMIRPIES